LSIKYNGERNIKPAHPGEMLREVYVNDYYLTIAGLAEKLGDAPNSQ